MSRSLDEALKALSSIDEDGEILTFRVYRADVCIEEFRGTKGQWFDYVIGRSTGTKKADPKKLLH